MTGCEINKCKYWDGFKCNDPIEYVNKLGEYVCGRREDAIPYDEYIEMLEENPPMMWFDKPSEY